MVRELSVKPQAVLIIPKRGDKLVLVNADIIEDLVEFRQSAQLSSETTQHLQSALPSELNYQFNLSLHACLF